MNHRVGNFQIIFGWWLGDFLLVEKWPFYQYFWYSLQHFQHLFQKDEYLNILQYDLYMIKYILNKNNHSARTIFQGRNKTKIS